jgi:CBS domain containing-hemolysin-like protein
MAARTPKNVFDIFELYILDAAFPKHTLGYKLKAVMNSDLILAIVLLLLSLWGVVARKTYFYLPPKELKRQAEENDPVALKLYRAVAYGDSLRGLLWLYIGVTSAASIVLLARILPIWASLLIVGPLLWVAFSLVPAGRTTRLGVRLTLAITPAVSRLLSLLHPALSRSTTMVERRYSSKDHTRLFNREDLLELIERQQSQTDSRLSEAELEVARRALHFNDYHVSDVLVPRKKLKNVLTKDTVGPILIDELHKAGQAHLAVRETSKGSVVGTLSLSRLGIESKGKVGDVMDTDVYYLHENDSLSEALHAFFATDHPVFVVVNNFEEYLGVVSVENIIEQLLGQVEGEDFEHYENLSAVAARHTKEPEADLEPVEPGPAQSKDTPVKTDEEVVK